MDDSAARRRLLTFTIAAVAAWGAILTLGSYLGLDDQTPDRDWRRLAIMAGCSGVFVGGWLLALWLRSRRTK